MSKYDETAFIVTQKPLDEDEWNTEPVDYPQEIRDKISRLQKLLAAEVEKTYFNTWR